MCRGLTDPAHVSYNPAMARQPAIHFSAAFEPLPPELAVLPVLSPIGNGLFQPLIKATNTDEGMVKKGLKEAITYWYKLLDLKVFDFLTGLIIGKIETVIKNSEWQSKC